MPDDLEEVCLWLEAIVSSQSLDHLVELPFARAAGFPLVGVVR